MSKTSQPAPLALTMGEPAGIGPELIGRLWQARKDTHIRPFIYVGASACVKDIPFQEVASPQEVSECFDSALPVLNIPLAARSVPGKLDPENGAAVIKAIDTAVELSLDGKCSGVVTAPIHKAGLYKAGFDAPGHTEYLARLAGKPDDYSVMMLAAKDLRVIPVTIHIPLKDVASQLTSDRIFHAGMIAATDLKYRFGIKEPRIAIAGLNPHAGESGTIGMEEATHIMPAIWQLREEGLSVTDPLPGDTLFHAEAREHYDVVLCMYHDQALIPVKTVDFWGGVNITLGLPFIRTSPDHGTALELAGQNTARLDSMLAAVKMAETMAERELSHG